MTNPFSAVKRARYLSEFLGCAFFIGSIKLSVYAGDFAAFTIGLMLCCQIYQHGYISGGHLNPAVTTSILISGGIKKSFETNDYIQIILYYISQLSGALFGGLIGSTIGGKKACLTYTFIDNNNYELGQAFLAEFWYTYLLCSVVLSCGIHQAGNQFYGFNIGLCLFFAVLSIGSITGACINPAVWFGTTMSALVCEDKDNKIQVKYVWIYLLSEFSAALLSGLVFRFIFKPADEYDNDDDDDSSENENVHAGEHEQVSMVSKGSSRGNNQ